MTPEERITQLEAEIQSSNRTGARAISDLLCDLVTTPKGRSDLVGKLRSMSSEAAVARDYMRADMLWMAAETLERHRPTDTTDANSFLSK